MLAAEANLQRRQHEMIKTVQVEIWTSSVEG